MKNLLNVVTYLKNLDIDTLSTIGCIVAAFILPVVIGLLGLAQSPFFKTFFITLLLEFIIIFGSWGVAHKLLKSEI